MEVLKRRQKLRVFSKQPQEFLSKMLFVTQSIFQKMAFEHYSSTLLFLMIAQLC